MNMKQQKSSGVERERNRSDQHRKYRAELETKEDDDDDSGVRAKKKKKKKKPMALEHARRVSQRTRTGHWPKARPQPIIPGPGNPPRGFVVTVRGRLCAFRGWLHTQSSRAISSSIIKLLIGTGE